MSLGTSVNFKNEFTKKIDNSNLHKNIPDVIGNDYIVNTINSSKDDEHYFDSFRKFIDLKLQFISGNFIEPNSASFQLIDSFGDPGLFGEANGIDIDPSNGAVYVVGRVPFGVDYQWVVRKLLFANSNFETIDSPTTAGGGIGGPQSVAVSPIDGAVYVSGRQDFTGQIRKSTSGLSRIFHYNTYFDKFCKFA